jgi:hypothetical protein
MEESPAAIERSDVCAVPAASIVGEAMVAIVLAAAVLEKFGGDTMPDLISLLEGVPAAAPDQPDAGARLMLRPLVRYGDPALAKPAVP